VLYFISSTIDNIVITSNTVIVLFFVVVTSNNDVWALDKEGRLYRRDVHVVPRQTPSPKADVSVVENDWQIV